MRKIYNLLTLLVVWSASMSTSFAQLSLTTSFTDNTCYGSCDGTITCSVTGQQGPVEYSVDGGATYQSGTMFSGLCRGTYTVIARDSALVMDSSTITVNEPSQLVPYVIITDASSSSATDGQADASSTYGGTYPYSYSWSSGATGSLDTNLTWGNYTLTVTDANGCIDSLDFFIDSIYDPCDSYYVGGSIIVNASSSSNCDGEANVYAGGTGPYTYSWSNGTTTFEDTALCWGYYSISVTDANGCLDSTTIFIDSTICSGFDVGVSQLDPSTSPSACDGYANMYYSGGSGVGTWTWSPSVSSTYFADSICWGNYSVTYTDTYGCTDSVTFFVDSFVNPCANFSAGYGSVYDETGSGMCDGYADGYVNGGTAPFSYLWTSGETTLSANNLCGGNNTLVITDANGCSDSITVYVGTQGPCSGYSAQLYSYTDATSSSNCDGYADVGSSGSYPWTFEWSHDSTLTESFDSTLCWGYYDVVVTDSNGCADTVSFFIDSIYDPCTNYGIYTDLVFNETTPGACDGEATAVAYNSLAPYIYEWSSGGSDERDTTLCFGQQWLTITDANGCVDTTYFFIDSVYNPCDYFYPYANVYNETGSCDGGAVIYPHGGHAPYTYSWSTSATTDSISNLCAGAYGYTVTDANGCSYSDSVYVDLSCVLTLNISTTDETCYGANDGTLTVNIPGGTAPFVYSIDQGATIDSTNFYSNLSPGTYIVMAQDSAECFGQDSITINAAALFEVDTNATVIDATCLGNDGSVTGLSVNGGTAPYTYQWTGGNVGTTTSLDLNNASAGSWYLDVTDNNGCIASTPTYWVNQISSTITVTVSTTNVSCFGGFDGSATASASGGSAPYSYSWSSGSGNAASATNLAADSGWVQVTDANACSSIQTAFNITEPAQLIISSTLTAENCGNSDGAISTVVGGGTSPYSYYWNTGATTNVISGVQGGMYEVTVLDASGCVEIEQFNLPNNDFTVSSVKTDPSCSDSFDGAIDVTVVPSGVYSFQWSNGETTEDVTDLSAGYYSVTISDGNCQTVFAETLIDPANISFVGTSSTPNTGCSTGDGSVDVIASGGVGMLSTELFDGSGSSLGIGTSFSGLFPGSYLVITTDANGCMDSTLVGVSSTPSTPMNISIDNVSAATCSGNNPLLSSDGIVNITVSGGVAPFQYFWRKHVGNYLLMSTAEDPTNLSSGDYVLEVSDAMGCSEFITVDVPGANLAPQPICLVTVTADSLNNQQNIVVWEKNQGLGIEQYEVWREEANGAWQLRGVIPFSQLSQFVDNGVDPTAVSYQYKLKTIDACNNVSVFQAEHRTIHLAANNYVPATTSVDGTIDLSWNAYIGINGVSSYVVERVVYQNGVETRTDISTIPENGQTSYSFQDTQVPFIDTTNTTLFYSIRVDLLNPCTATKAQSHNTTRSNRATISGGGGYPTENTSIDELEEMVVSVYPNPSQGLFNVEVSIKSGLVIYNSIGQVVYQSNLFEGVNSVDLSNLQNGFYYMSIQNGDKKVTKSIILQH